MNKLFVLFLLMGGSLLTYGQTKVIDFHMHLWDKEKSIAAYMKHIDSLNLTVDKVGGIIIANQGDIEQTKFNNDSIIHLSKKYQKLFPICSVHPYDGEKALKELKRLNELGVKVVKLHPLNQGLDVYDEQVVSFCEMAGELEIIVLIDNAYFLKPDNSEGLLSLAIKCSKTKFVYAHMGATNFRFWNTLKLIETAEDFYKGNIYFDIAGTVTLLSDSPIEDEFVWTLRNIGTDKILLGSDFPQWTIDETFQALDKLDLTEEEKEQIKFSNAFNLLTE